jgi:hypothetical protein
MTPREYSEFLHHAVHSLKALNDDCENKFQLSKWPRYDYDLNSGTLTFSKDRKPKVVAYIQVVGTTSSKSNTWLWAWANQHFPPKVVQDMERVRAFGNAESLPQLTEEQMTDSEYLGWEMTAVAAYILGSKGAYRCPSDNGYIYVTYSNLAYADGGSVLTVNRHQINCDTHGRSYATFLCEHLIADPRQKWYSAECSDSNPWPDAWCARCEELFQQQGEWNENNESKLKAKVLCHQCYERFRPAT